MRSQNKFHQCVLMQDRNNVSLFRFSIYHIFSLFFNIIDNTQGVNPNHFSISFLDLQTSQRCIILSFVSCSFALLFYCLNYELSEFAVGTNWNMAYASGWPCSVMKSEKCGIWVVCTCEYVEIVGRMFLLKGWLIISTWLREEEVM